MKWIVAIIAVLFMASVAMAEQTSGATYVSPNGEICQDFVDFLNDQEYLDHSHDYYVDEGNDPYGLGVDAVVWENQDEAPIIEAVEVQAKYDIPNEETSAFLVAKVNLFNLFKKKAE